MYIYKYMLQVCQENHHPEWLFVRAVTLLLFVWAIIPLANKSLRLWNRARRIWKCVIGSRQRLRVAYFYRCLVSLSHGAYTSGSFAPLVRVTSSSLAFSLRELEIELYTLTQPSDYAIRRDTSRVDTCQRFEAETIENTDSFSRINLQRCK